MANLIGISEVICAMKTLRGPIRFDVIMAYLTMKHPEISGKAHVLVHYALRDAVRAGLIKKAPGGMYSYTPPTEKVSLEDDDNTSKTGQVAPDDKIGSPLVSKRRKGECKAGGRRRQKKKMESPKNSAGTKDRPTSLNLSLTSTHNQFNCSDTQNTAENETAHKEGTFSAEEESLGAPSGTSTDNLKNAPKKRVKGRNKRKQSLIGLRRTVKIDINKLHKTKAICTKKRPAAGQISLISLSGKSSDDLKKDVDRNKNDSPTEGIYSYIRPTEKVSLEDDVNTSKRAQVAPEDKPDPSLKTESPNNSAGTSTLNLLFTSVFNFFNYSDPKNTTQNETAHKEGTASAEEDSLGGPSGTSTDNLKTAPTKRVKGRNKRKHSLIGLRRKVKIDINKLHKKKAIRKKKRPAAGQISLISLSDLNKDVECNLNDSPTEGMYSYIPPTEKVSLEDDVNTSKTAQVAPDDKIDPPLASKRRKGECKEGGRRRQKKKIELPKNVAGTKDPATTLKLSLTSTHTHFNCSDAHNTAENETAHKEVTFSAEEESLAGPSRTSTDDFKNAPKLKVKRRNRRKQTLLGLPRTVKIDINKLHKKKAIGTRKRPAAGQMSLISLSGKSSPDLKKDVDRNKNDSPTEGIYSYIRPTEKVSLEDDVNTSKRAQVAPEDKPDPSLKTESPNNSAGTSKLKLLFTSIFNFFKYSDPKNATKNETAHKEGSASVEEESLAGPSATSTDFKNTFKKKVIHRNKRYPSGKQSLIKLLGAVNKDVETSPKMKVPRTKKRPPAGWLSCTVLSGAANDNFKNVPNKVVDPIKNHSSTGANSLTGLDGSSTKVFKKCPKKNVFRKRKHFLAGTDSLVGLTDPTNTDAENPLQKKIIRHDLTNDADLKNADSPNNNDAVPKNNHSPDGKDLITDMHESTAGFMVPPAYKFKNGRKNKVVRNQKCCPAVKGSLTELVALSSANACVVCKERYVNNPSKQKTGEGDVLPAQKRKTRKAGKNRKVKANMKNAKSQSVSRSAKTKRVNFKI